MRYRRLDPLTGEPTFGSNNQNFLTSTDAIAQAVQTRLNLLKREWWEDVNDGLPLFQNILGSSGSPNNLKAIDQIYKKRILETTGVQSIDSFTSEFNPQTRAYSYVCTLTTIYSTTITTTGVL